ncbi:MAG: hypothetical protein WC492_04720 [Candidatus Micrarchaeia archaeon]
MLYTLAVSAICGFCAKLSDFASERQLQVPKVFAILSSIIYGAGLAFLTISSPLSSLFLALAFASTVCQKIDHPLHMLGLAVFTGFILIFPISSFDAPLFCLFLALAIFDELELKIFGSLSFLFENRLFVPIGAFLVFAYTGQIIFLASILAFDIFYRLCEFVFKDYLVSATKQKQSGKTKHILE